MISAAAHDDLNDHRGKARAAAVSIVSSSVLIALKLSGGSSRAPSR